MKLEDLRRLKRAIDTGNINNYHGDMSQAFIEVVNELLCIKERSEALLDKLAELGALGQDLTARTIILREDLK